MQLITASLYNAYYYYAVADYSSKQDFLDTLHKIYKPPNELIQKGIDFEKKIREESDESLSFITDIVRGGFWQESCKKPLEDLLLYGKMDVIKKDTIYDIKYCQNYEIGKYRNSIQHLLYMYCEDIHNFQYLISNGKDFWIEEYNWNADSESILKQKIYEMVDFINYHDEFREPFLNKWIAHDNKIKSRYSERV